MGPLTGDGVSPSHAVGYVASGKTESFAPGAATGGIFPFGLGWQTEGESGNAVQPPDELAGFVPVDKRDRMLRVAGQVQHLAFAHHGTPQTVGHFGRSYVIRGKKNQMRRLVGIGIRIILLRRGSHHKRTAFHALHFYRYAVHFYMYPLQRVRHMRTSLRGQWQRKKH